MANVITSTGINLKTIQGILLELAVSQRGNIDADLATTEPDTLMGQLNGVFASVCREIWEVIGILYHANNPNSAEDVLLDFIGAITGTERAEATRSHFIGLRGIVLDLNATTTVPQFTAFYVPTNPAVQFRTMHEETSTTAGEYIVDAECLITGPVTCNADTLTGITAPVIGLNSVTNPFDATVGRNIDTDPEFRIRRESELRASGSATVDAIRSDILAIRIDDAAPILACTVFENVTMATDVNGLPAKSFEALVFDGVDADVPDDTIAQAIWNSKPAGIQAYGMTSGTAVDSEGTERNVPFSRPVIYDLYVYLTVTPLNPLQVGSDYEDTVRVAVLAEFKRRVVMGGLIRPNHYEHAALSVPGVDEAVCEITIVPTGDPATGSTPDPIQLATRAVAFLDSTFIEVT